MMLILLDVEFTARHKCMQHIYSVYELRKTIYSFKNYQTKSYIVYFA